MRSEAAAGRRGPGGDRLRVTVLGSGTLVPDDARRSACHLVEALAPGDHLPRWSLLLDCGSGAVHGMTRFGLDPRALSHLVLSHYHLDHIGDLASLLFAFAYAPGGAREEPFTVIGPPGLMERFQGMARAFGSFLSSPPFPIDLVEVPRDGGWDDPEGRFRLRCFPTDHTPESVAWRVELPGGPAVGYTGDTGPTPGLGHFLAGVQLLIAECAFQDPPPWTGHLSPAGVADLAREARPHRLILTHLYPDVPRHEVPGLIARAGWEGDVEVASDGTRVTVTAPGHP